MIKTLKDIKRPNKKKVINLFSKVDTCICSPKPTKQVIISQETIGVGEYLLVWKCLICGITHKKWSNEVYVKANT